MLIEDSLEILIAGCLGIARQGPQRLLLGIVEVPNFFGEFGLCAGLSVSFVGLVFRSNCDGVRSKNLA
jgi:hypothetical protein